MLRKSLITAAVTLLLTPALASAGLVTVGVATGSSSGTVSPTGNGYKTAAVALTITPAAGMTLDKVTNNGTPVTVAGTGPYTYTIPLSAVTQQVYAYFKLATTSYPTYLEAKVPASITAVSGAAVKISAQQSIIKYMPPTGTPSQKYVAFRWTAAGATTFSPYSGLAPNANYLTTMMTATTNSDTITLTLKGNGVTSSASTAVVGQNHGTAASNACLQCHAGWPQANEYAAQTAGHAANSHGPACQDCHAGSTHPGSPQCASCHASDSQWAKFAELRPYSAANCGACHNAGNIHTSNPFTGTIAICAPCHSGGTHDLQRVAGSSWRKLSCLDCHGVALAKHNGVVVNDNNGVRAITPEFGKRSHHITGGQLKNEQCVVCHMEGKKVTFSNTSSQIVIDPLFHMKDDKTYLRDADTDAPIAWSGTEHTDMDNFCFSCHDSNGATSAGIAAIMTGKNFGGAFQAKNPFADTLTNGYDQVARAGVVDVKTAFTTTNASHHAVSGQRYKYRFSTVANAAAWAERTGNPMPSATDIAEGHEGEESPNGGEIEGFGTGLLYDPAGEEKGGEATLYEAGKFVSTYLPLGDSLSVGDNSVLHCGDCHTVGQWKVGSSTNADGTATTAAIGAHGSANEYMLRNSLGTDALHNGLTYVCFNCHKTELAPATATLWNQQVADKMFAAPTAPPVGSADNPLGLYIPLPMPTWKAGWNALHPVVFAGQLSGYATAHAVSAFHAQCQADSADNIGATNRLAKSWAPHVVKSYDYSPAAGATASAPSTGSDANSGNLTGIACTSCHNSGLRSGWGGIHGGNNTYTDGLGRVQTTYRFMPGMGNYRYAPPGGWDGKDTSDPTLLTQHNPLYPGTPGSRTDQSVGFPGHSGKPMGGCYTNSALTGADPNTGWGACDHHGTSTAASVGNMATKPANFRTTYGGGTTATPTAFEPTIREATAGGTLVTRPLKY